MNRAVPAQMALAASLALLSLRAPTSLAQDRLKPGKPAGVLEMPRDTAVLAISHDGKRVVTSDRKRLQLWDVAAGKPLRDFELRSNFGYVWSASFSRDGAEVVAAFGSGPARSHDPDRCARVFDTATGKKLREFPHAHPVFAAALSPDGKSVLTGTGGLKNYQPDDVVMRLWSVPTGKEVRAFPHPTSETHSVESVAFSADGMVAYSRGNHLLFRWDLKTGKELGRVRFGEPQVGYHVLLTENGRALANELGGGSVILWDLKERDPLRKLRADVLGDPKKQFEGDVFCSIGPYEITPDGKAALVALATVRRTTEASQQAEPGRGNRPVVTSTTLASQVVLWDVEGDKVLRTFPRAAEDSAYPVLLSGDGGTALIGTAQGFHIWKLSH